MQPFRFQPSEYGPVTANLLVESRLPALGPGSPEPEVHVQLRRFDPLVDFAQPIRDPLAARACLAGLWLYFDYLNESHAISQDLSTPEGSFWHAVMHRREPDAWNSKYWWRQVGAHPVLGQLATESPALGYRYTSAEAFVDSCERVRGTVSEEETVAQQVQLLEWRLLFDWCFRKAAG